MMESSEFDPLFERAKDILLRKQHDYGKSFHRIFQKFGLLSSVIRLSDKLARLETLVEKDSKVKDESVIDTLYDIMNYAVLTINELENSQKVQGKMEVSDLGKTDVYPAILRNYEIISKKLESLPFLVREDTNFFRFEDDSGYISFTCGHLIFFNDGCYPWIKLKVGSWQRVKFNPKDKLKEILKCIELQRFKDEDNFDGWFFDEKEDMAWCLISPEFPDGYWENHTLDQFRPLSK